MFPRLKADMYYKFNSMSSIYKQIWFVCQIENQVQVQELHVQVCYLAPVTMLEFRITQVHATMLECKFGTHCKSKTHCKSRLTARLTASLTACTKKVTFFSCLILKSAIILNTRYWYTLEVFGH